MVLRYRGLDGIERQTRVRSLRAPDRTEEGSLSFLASLEPHAYADIEIAISCEVDDKAHALRRYSDTVAELRRQGAEDDERACKVLGSNHVFNRWIRRSPADLRMMITNTPHGPYPYAGIPWFSTPFGRDGIITARHGPRGPSILLVQACLGLRIDAAAQRVSFEHAVLPELIDWLRIINLAVGAASVDLLLTRHAYDVGVTVLRSDGVVEIIAAK